MQLVGENHATRQERRNRGGQSGLKGVRYETLFGAHRIARLIKKMIDTGEDAVVEWQTNEFVDDFVVRRDEQLSFKAYQLKNSADVSWTAGDPSIAMDFELQSTVSRDEGYTDVRLRLVCSDAAIAEQLQGTVPARIADSARAVHFPYAVPVLELLRQTPWLAGDFGWLARSGAPSAIESENIAVVILGAWEALAPQCLVSAVYAKAREVSPVLLRPRRSDAEAGAILTQHSRDVLGGIPGFEYSIVRGFLHWSAVGGTMKGVLSYDCFSDQFAGFQDFLLRRNPQSFDDIEGVLL